MTMCRWSQRPFIDYLNAVDRLLESRSGRTSRDEDLADISAAQEAGDTPEECAQWLGVLITNRGPDLNIRPPEGDSS